MQYCGVCGSSLRVSARFCDQCGTRVTGSPPPTQVAVAPVPGTGPAAAALEPVEKKSISVLFTDVVGSMELSGILGPERWRELMDEFFAVTCDVIARYGGTVHQFTGDGASAFFGIPSALEDHAVRACLAALDLRTDLRPIAEQLRGRDGAELRLRTGLGSGEVISGGVGGPAHHEYTALGHAIGLAKRMESLAPPAGIALGEATAQLVRGRFELQSLGKFQLKGIAEPQDVYELIGPGGVRSRFELATSRGLSRFLGRENEQTVLERALTRALDGDGQVVSVVAEAGTGKTRLCHELIATRVPAGTKVLVAGNPSHAQAIPFLFLREMLARLFSLHEAADPLRARNQVESSLRATAPDLIDDLAIFLGFLGLHTGEGEWDRLDPDARRRRLLSATQEMIRARSSLGPAVLLLDDLHWMDEASAPFLDALMPIWTTTRTLVLATFRPGFSAAWMRGASYTELALPPLSTEAMQGLLDDLMGRDPAVAPLRQLVLERSAGNPFFAEEIVRSLLETAHLEDHGGRRRRGSSTVDVQLPDGVRAVVASRIDRLARPARAMLQVAAVVGDEVPLKVLEQVLSPEAVREDVPRLVRAELLVRDASTSAGRYRFSHPLVREVAYATQLSASRAATHIAVAGVIEQVHRDQLDEQAALIAHHLEAGGENAGAALWHTRAARRALATSPAEAMEHWRRARALAGVLPDSAELQRLRLSAARGILALGSRIGLAEDEAESLRDEAAELARSSGDDRAARMVELVYARNLILGRRELEGIQAMMPLLREALAEGDSGLAAGIVAGLGWFLVVVGRIAEARELTVEVIELTGDDPTAGSGEIFQCPVAQCHFVLGAAEAHLGRTESGAAAFERAIRLAHDYGDEVVENHARAALTILPVMVLAPADLRVNAERNLEIAERQGSAESLANALVGGTYAALGSRDWSSARRYALEALQLLDEQPVAQHHGPLAHAGLAEASLGERRVEEAGAASATAVELARSRGLRTHEVRALRVSAAVQRITSGDVSVAARSLERAAALAAEIGSLAESRLVAREREALDPRMSRERARG